jgi:hypothetical protein
MGFDMGSAATMGDAAGGGGGGGAGGAGGASAGGGGSSAAAAGSAVIGAAADILGGASQYSAAKAEAKQYEQNARNAMIAADQRQGERMRDLQSTLSSIDALRTGRGLDPTSPTGVAIRERVDTDAQRAIGIDRTNALQQSSANYNAATAAKSAGKAAYIGGFLKAGAKLVGAAGGGK